MTITAVCTSCGRSFKAPEQFAGKRVKCKNCGIVFQIPSATSAINDQDTELGALEQLERTAGGSEIPPSSPPPPKAKIGPKLEKKLEANPDTDEIPMTGPTEISGQRNIMPFRYPGARQIDQWLPLGLLLMGLIGVAAVVAAVKDANDQTWISFSRYAIVVFFYLVLIFPITLSMLRKAAAEMRYRLPPNHKLRTFGIYMPAFALTTCFWFAGNGSVLGLILGLLFGLALSSAALWLLFRLRESELATSVSHGAGGFVLGAGISIGLILGLNALTLLIVNKTKSEAKIPASPFSPGLVWVPAPPPPVIARKPPVPTPAIVQPVVNDTPASPIISNLAMDQIPPPITAIIRPLSHNPTIAIVRNAENNSVIIEAWDTTTWQKIGTDLRLTSPVGQYALSCDGQTLAYVDHFPRLCVKTWSFATGNLVPPRIDLEAKDGEPRLIGFSSANRLLIRWLTPDQVAADIARTAQPWTIEVVDTTINGTNPKIITEKLEAGSSPIAISTAAQQLAAACKLDSGPALVQYDLNSGDILKSAGISINEIDPTQPVAPRGLAYSSDGKQLGVLFEINGGAVLESYDAQHGGKPKLDLEYPEWPPDNVDNKGFKENALAWLDPSPALLVYGQSVIATATSKPITGLMVPNVIDQRILTGDRIELIVNQGNAKRIITATLDREKLSELLNPPATAPTPAP